jgi:hypothetical protein
VQIEEIMEYKYSSPLLIKNLQQLLREREGVFELFLPNQERNTKNSKNPFKIKGL